MTDHGEDGRPVVAGIFHDRTAAREAIARLIDHHFEPDDDISVVLTDEAAVEHEDIPIRDELQIIEGAEIGGAIGALLGGTGAGLVAAGLLAGPVALVAMGPVAAALNGALAVGAWGVFTGWVAGLGIEKQEADFHAAHIEKGAVWVGVHATGERGQMALDVLQEAGAERLTAS